MDNLITDQLTSFIKSINKQKQDLILNRIQVLGLLPIPERLTKVCQGDEEIWYYDYNTDEVKFIIYFKGMGYNHNISEGKLTFSVEYF